MTVPTEPPRKEPKKIKGVLIDLSGTIHIGDEEIPGARNALRRLRSAAKARETKDDLPLVIRFLTNTSTKSVASLLDHLNNEEALNFEIPKEEMVTSLQATAAYVREKNLNPLLLLEDASDFDAPLETAAGAARKLKKDPIDKKPSKIIGKPYDSVVVGLAPSKFCYEHLNEAFRILLEHPDNLIAVHRGNYLKEKSIGGQEHLSIGPGAFVTALETSSGCSPAKVIGKPSLEIFESAIHSMNREIKAVYSSNGDNNGNPTSSSATTILDAKDVCMIGDDVWTDCQGALDAGIGTAILVQTGKYRLGDEEKWKEAVSTSNDRAEGELLVRPSIIEAIEYVLELIQNE